MTEIIPLSIFEGTHAQGVITEPFPPAIDSPPVLLRSAAVLDGPPNLTCRIIYYGADDDADNSGNASNAGNAGNAGPFQGEAFNLAQPLITTSAETAIAGARYIYCDDVPMESYVGGGPFIPT